MSVLFHLRKSYRFSCLLLLSMVPALASDVRAAKLPVTVIAVEYAPYTSYRLPDNGASFRFLNQLLHQYDSAVSVQAKFYPAARAERVLESQDWEASFYPPGMAYKAYYRNIELTELPLKLSLFRVNQGEKPFRWRHLTDLKGRVVFVRRLSRGPIRDAFASAGLEVISTDDLEQGFRLLKKGRAEYIFAEYRAGLQAASLAGLKQNNIQFAQNVLMSVPLNIWVNPYSEGGLQLLNELTRIRNIRRRPGVERSVRE